MADEQAHVHEHTPHVHVTSIGVYLAVFAALAAGTLLTWWVSTINLELTMFGAAISLNTPIALLIAGIKAALVILFFMHVIHSTRLTWVVIIASFLWLGVLFVLTFADYLTRLWNLT
jgi:cytochrome c oxidase subunit IV